MRIRNFLAALVIILVFCPFVFSKEWYQLYDDGRKAIDKNNCSEGVKYIKEALEKNSKSDLKARPYGTITWEYIPHFYLAKCAVASGDYAAADMYISEAKKVDMYSSSKASEFRSMTKLVEGKLKAVKQPGGTQVAQNQQQQNTPPAQNPPVKEPIKQPTGTTTTPTVTPSNPQLTQQTLINRALEDARSAYAAGNYDEARNAANRVLILDKNNREANKLLSQISGRESAELAARAKQQKLEDARRAMNRGDLTVAESTILQLRAEYPNDRTIESLAKEIQQKRVQQMEQMSTASRQKENERQVIRAYFEGKYVAVVELADTYLSQYPNSWRLHFFKGCAHAALGLMDEKKKDSSMIQAREAFRKARANGGDIRQPDQISPKIWDIYRNS